jgi:hypothetical protein
MQRIKFVLSHFSAALAALLGREDPLKSIYRHGQRIRLRQVRPGDVIGVFADDFGAADYYRVMSWPMFPPLSTSWGCMVEDAVEP